METYLEDVEKLIKIRIRTRVMSSLREEVSEIVTTKLKSIRERVEPVLKQNGQSEAEIDAFFNDYSKTLTETVLNEHGSRLITAIPDMVIKETQILKAELTKAVDSAAKEAGKELVEELAG